MIAKITLVNLSGSQNKVNMRARFVGCGKGGQGWYGGGVTVGSMYGIHV